MFLYLLLAFVAGALLDHYFEAKVRSFLDGLKRK